MEWLPRSLRPGEAHGAHKSRYAARRATLQRGREDRAAPAGMTAWGPTCAQNNFGLLLACNLTWERGCATLNGVSPCSSCDAAGNTLGDSHRPPVS